MVQTNWQGATITRGSLIALAARGTVLESSCKELTAAYAAHKALLAAKEKPVRLKIPGVNAKFKEFQAKGINWILMLRQHGFGGVLGDDRGMGKTLEVIGAIALYRHRLEKEGVDPGPQVVLVERKDLEHWKRMMQTFAPQMPYYVLHGDNKARSAEQMAGNAFVLTTYNTFLSCAELLRKLNPHFVFMDEARALKNPMTRRWESVSKFRGSTLVPITGTPIDRNIKDLHSLLELAAPGVLGSIQDFGKRYEEAAAKPENPSSIRFLEELRCIISPFFLRRRKKDVPGEFPEKEEISIPIELAFHEASAYERVRKAQHREMQTIRETIPRHQQPVAMRRVLERVRRSAASVLFDGKISSKASYAIDLVNELLTGGHSVLVFSHFNSLLMQLSDQFNKHAIDHSLYLGDAVDRDLEVSRFKRGASRVMLVSKLGASGLDLPEADSVIIFDGWINQAEMDQMGDRAHRLVSESEVTVYKLVSAETIEDIAASLLERFQGAAHAVLDGDGTVVSSLKLADEDYDRLLAPTGWSIMCTSPAAGTALTEDAGAEPEIPFDPVPPARPSAADAIRPAGKKRLSAVRRNLDILERIANGEDVTKIARKTGMTPANIYILVPKTTGLCLIRSVDLFPDAGAYPPLAKDSLFMPGETAGVTDVKGNKAFWLNRIGEIRKALEGVVEA